MNNLKIKRKDAVALVIVDRPEKLNALNRETIEELSEALAALEADPRVRVLILTGSGNKAFVAGADISEFSSFSQKQGEQLARLGQEKLFDLLENMSKIVIGAINGFALGGGLELAMSCHFRYASETARMGLPEVTLGVIPGYGGTQRLPMLVGKGMAMDMLSTGRMIKADEALQVGLVNRLCAPEDLLEECMKTAQKIAANSSTAIAEAINAVNAGMLDRRQGYEQEKTSFGYCFGTADFKEGTEAFLSKRKPNFG